MNLIRGSVVIEDLRVRLDGVGDSTVVSAEAADASQDLKDNAGLVKVETVKGQDEVPFWPFIKPGAPEATAMGIVPPAAVPEEMAEIRRRVRNIDESLKELLSRPSPAPPEVVAAHVRTIGGLPSIPHGLPGAPNLPGHGSGEDPVFLPSRMVPDGVEASIRVDEVDLEKGDLDEGLAALARLRKK